MEILLEPLSGSSWDLRGSRLKLPDFPEGLLRDLASSGVPPPRKKPRTPPKSWVIRAEMERREMIERFDELGEKGLAAAVSLQAATRGLKAKKKINPQIKEKAAKALAERLAADNAALAEMTAVIQETAATQLQAQARIAIERRKQAAAIAAAKAAEAAAAEKRAEEEREAAALAAMDDEDNNEDDKDSITF